MEMLTQPLVRESEMQVRVEMPVWQYGSLEELPHFMSILRRENNIEPAYLEHVLEHGGGKALGLEVCHHIADHSEFPLIVPRWLSVSTEEAKNFACGRPMEKFILRDTKIRSSARNEDWVDASAGRLTSYNGADYSGKRMMKSTLGFPDVPFVLQEQVHGFGLVVDVSHSENLGDTAIRIASGRRDEGGKFSSATSDVGATVAVYDRSGTMLTAAVGEWETLFTDKYKFPFAKLVPSLVKALQATGVYFGVQLELVVDPTTLQAHLVQVRPTPDNGKRQVKNMSDAEKTPGQLVKRILSPLVSASFDQVWPVGRASDSVQQPFPMSGFPDLEAVVRSPGVVQLMDKRLSLSFSALLQAVKNNGARAFVMQDMILPNTTHAIGGSMNAYDLAAMAFLCQHIPMVALDKIEYQALTAVLNEMPQAQLRLRSDGIVGIIEVYKS